MTCYHYTANGKYTKYEESLLTFDDIIYSSVRPDHKIIRWWLGIRFDHIPRYYSDKLADFGIHRRQNWFCFALPTLRNKQQITINEIRQNIPCELMNKSYWVYGLPFHDWFVIYEVDKNSFDTWQLEYIGN